MATPLSVLSRLILLAVLPGRGAYAHFTDGKAGRVKEEFRHQMGLNPLCPGGGVQMVYLWTKFRGVSQVGPREGKTLV